ncbi:hypothetical protein MCHI_000849 [Candidatus Magnetoovum chiemensis]|nr:hypothetical protein MCHI_000849 [Candidatus Magnetoovum chiemensis]
MLSRFSKKSVNSKDRQIATLFVSHYLSVVDLGSGYGTIPHALLSINEYILDKLKAAELPIFPFDIDILRIDKSLASLNIGKEIVDAFNCDKIKIKDKQIVEQLPEADYIHIIDRISKHKPLVVIMSNLVRWLTDEECSELIDNLCSSFQLLNNPIKVYLRINAVLKEEKGILLRFLETIRYEFDSELYPPN